ncbi:hypothetical protein EYF80_055876 [Liparis tanakae]|uniref:Uncharacterized protein n=1 Tax=Liparis tanakae TaxID=230148 RepID=A0A4Z2EZD9_9TELE|nr:hypothetical protein EYF80_055876 [Liparis tanakae]
MPADRTGGRSSPREEGALPGRRELSPGTSKVHRETFNAPRTPGRRKGFGPDRRRTAATPPRRHAATPPRRHAVTPPRRHAATYSLNVTVRQLVVMSVITIFPRKGRKDGNVSSSVFLSSEEDVKFMSSSSSSFTSSSSSSLVSVSLRVPVSVSSGVFATVRVSGLDLTTLRSIGSSWSGYPQSSGPTELRCPKFRVAAAAAAVSGALILLELRNLFVAPWSSPSGSDRCRFNP